MSDTARFFADTYAEARHKFLTTAEQAGLAVDSRIHPLTGLDGETLAVDAVRIGPTDAGRVIVASSGAHGVEGFAGSAIQCALMETMKPADLPADTAIALLHALNPHGMSWSRRECEDGTDLTRNLSHHLYPPFDNPQYELFHPLIVPPDVQADTLAAGFERFEQICAEHGIENPTPILRRGQYTHPDGLTYHGPQDPVWATRQWIDLTRNHASQAAVVALVDIHTGFGDCADLLTQCASYPRDHPSYALLTRWLGEEPAGYSDDGSIIQHRIITFEALHRVCRPDAQVAAMYFEFGTLPASEYIEPWLRNNWHYCHGDRRSPEAAAARRDFADFCYVRTPKWKASVVSKGLTRLQQILARL